MCAVDFVSSRFWDWMFSGIITFFSVRIATGKYYNYTKRQVSKGIMELGLRSLLKLEYDEALPDYAQTVFVIYKGHRFFNKKDREKYDCRFYERIRKTIAVVGGNKSEVSPFRPLNYGVLGIANKLSTPVIYDFKFHELYTYKKGAIKKLNTVVEQQKCKYVDDHENKFVLSRCETERDVMLAIPLRSCDRLVGGLTFDLKTGEKTLYRKYTDGEDIEEKEEKDAGNIRVFKEANRAATILINAFFKRKGEELE